MTILSEPFKGYKYMFLDAKVSSLLPNLLFLVILDMYDNNSGNG